MSINIVVRLSDANVGSSQDREDVVLAHQEHFPFAAQLELLTGVGGEQDNVANLDLELAALAILRDPALTDRDHLALLRLVLGGVGQNDPTGRRSLGLFPFNDDAIAQWLEFHRPCLPDGVRRDLTSMPAIAFPMAARSPERHAENTRAPNHAPLVCNRCAYQVLILKPHNLNLLRPRLPILESPAPADRGRQPATSAISAVKRCASLTGERLCALRRAVGQSPPKQYREIPAVRKAVQYGARSGHAIARRWSSA